MYTSTAPAKRREVAPVRHSVAAAVSGVALCVALAGAAQDPPARPDFSGIWKFNPSKSDTADVPKRSSWIIDIKHTGKSFSIAETIEGDAGERRTYEIGGTAVLREDERFGTTSSRYWWEGSSLVSEFQWENGVTKDVRTLSADRQVLTDDRTIDQAARGAPPRRVMHLIFERQPDPVRTPPRMHRHP